MLSARGSGGVVVSREASGWIEEFRRFSLPIAGYEAISCIVFARCRARLCALRRIAGRLSSSSSGAIAGGCCSIFLRLFAGLVVAGMHLPRAVLAFLVKRKTGVGNGELTVCCWANIESDDVVVLLYRFAAAEFALGDQSDVYTLVSRSE